MKIVFCGRLQDAAGRRSAEVDPPAHICSALAVRDWISADDPRLGDMLRDPSVRIVVNDEVLIGDRHVAPGDEIAFMPPVSGG
jgi:molybdopterin synthase sulfur carrier subunit